jgi:hypothetical protein
MKTSIILVAISAILSVGSAYAEQPEPVQVVMVNGRTLIGYMTPSDSSDVLTIRNSVPGISITTSIPILDVSSIQIGTETFSVDRFRQAHSHTGNLIAPVDPPRRISQAQALPVRVEQRKVQHISIDARTANWDSDPAVDGLELCLRVFGANHTPVSVGGQLSVCLTGIIRPDQSEQYVSRRTDPVKQLEKWTVQVDSDEFHEGVTVVQLPFRKLIPQEDIDIAPWAGVNVSYAVSSNGVFRAELADVALRDPSLFRDDVYLSTGRRTQSSESNNSLPGRSRNILLRRQMR